MLRPLSSRTPWLLALACAACAAFFLRDLAPALYVAPALSLGAVLLLWLRPWAGGSVAVVGVATELLLGVPPENPSWLATAVVTFYVLGRRAPWWHGWLLVMSSAGTLVALEQATLSQRIVDSTFVTFVVGTAWGFGRAVRRRAASAERARAETERLVAEDSALVIARVVEEERRRLAAELVGVVTEAVATMRADATRAGNTLDSEAIASIASRGARAMTEMRRLVGLLRAEPEEGLGLPAEPSAAGRRRRPWVDPVTGLAVGALWVAETAFDPGKDDVLALWPVILVVVAVWIRRIRPLVAAILLLVPVLAALWFGAPDPGAVGLAASLALALVAWSIGTQADVWGFGMLGALAVAVVMLGHELSPGNEAITIASIALPLVCGYLWTHFGSQQEAEERRARERRAEIDAEVACAVAAERLRVARDLHDVTSHALGVMVLQAGAAEATAASKPDVARAALAHAVAAGDEALSELAGLSRMFGPAPVAEDGGSFGVQLAELVSRMRAAGLQITTVVEVEPSEAVAAQTAYRVAQEALTNAARHAKGAQVILRIAENGDDLEISIVNDGRGAAPAGSTSGFGLVGLAERVRALGGTLAADAMLDGGFSVHALIPRADGELLTANVRREDVAEAPSRGPCAAL